jgi:hypothetical protein
MSNKLWKFFPILLGILLSLVFFVVINYFLLREEAAEVLKTGMCPAAPTDIPPYPCSIEEYLTRMIFGVWVAPVQMMILFFSMGNATAVILLFRQLFRKLFRKRP